MTRRIVIYPGTFDPLTYGHLDIIERASKLGDELIVAVAANAGKGPLLSIEDRTELVATEARRLAEDGTITTPIRVLNFSTLLTDFAREQGASVIVRGLRAVSDFEIEFQMASMNAKMAEDIETVCLMASDKYHFIASSLVKEIAKLNGDITQFVSPRVAERLAERLHS